jgi:diguanylate cyclase (GGDEF)-like protein/PAS domain S-box-containing protein
VTPTLRQRLGLAPARLAAADGRALLAARAASVLFAIQSGLALAAAAVGGSLGWEVAAGASAAAVVSLLVFVAYERLPWLVSQLLAVGGSAVAAFLVFTQPSGEQYAWLFVAPVTYVCFFFRGRNALANVAIVSVLAGAAFADDHALRGGLESWILVVGALGQAAATTIVLRRQLFQLSQRLRGQRAVLDAFFLHAAGGFAFLDAEHRFVRVNEPLARMIGLPVESIVGRTVREITPHDADTIEPLLGSILTTHEPVVGIELASPDGLRHYLVDYYPVGESLGIGMSVVDVTRLKHSERSLTESNRQLTVLATTDELTGLPNRRMFSEQLALALARARRGGLAVALLSIDLDGFKSVNDSLGHAYGDQLLVEVAALLRAGARDTDVVARIGGDEFVVVLADLDVQDSADTVETVVERIEGLLGSPISVGPVELRADASIGVAIYPLDAREQDDLLGAADAAMYRRKHAATRVA